MLLDNNKARDILREAIAVANRKPYTFEKKFKRLMVLMYNFPVGDAVDILNNKLPVEGMSLDTVYKTMRVLNELNKEIKQIKSEDAYDYKKLDVDKYFTDTQKRSFEVPIEDEVPVGDIVFEKYLQLNPDQYIVTASIDEIVKWRDARRLKYNENTQRKMTIKESKGVEVKSVTLNSEARNEIHELMEKNEFISNILAININPDYNEELPYVTKEGKLVIPAAVEIDISDGFHRYLEMTSVKDSNSNWEYTSAFYVTVFDENKANQFIWQEDHKNHLEKEQKETMNKSDELNYWLDRLNKSSKFHLKGTLDAEKLYVITIMVRNLFDTKNKKIDRAEGMKIYQSIESNINELVEEKFYFDKDITKQEWFIYITALHYSIISGLKFMDIINKVDIESLLKQFNFKNEPRNKQYKDLEAKLQEVMNNVL